MISFFVAGIPKPQGSKRAFVPPNAKHPVVVESAGEALKDWRGAVAYAAAQHGDERMSGPVSVTLMFMLPRPKSHYGTRRNENVLKNSAPFEHCQKPDIDKLSRAVLDALTSRLYADDSQVVSLQAGKCWSGRDTQPGCQIDVEEFVAQEVVSG